MERVRGTCVAVDGCGVLLRGRSGAGKSDLALRLLSGGGRLVADDYTCLACSHGSLRASAPESLSGLLEVRGLGIIRVDAEADVPLVAVVDLVPREAVERMPVAEKERLLGIDLPRFQIAAFDVSAVAKVRLVVSIARGTIVRQT
jgi:HPr kinase/phosphorylase